MAQTVVEQLLIQKRPPTALVALDRLLQQHLDNLRRKDFTKKRSHNRRDLVAWETIPPRILRVLLYVREGLPQRSLGTRKAGIHPYCVHNSRL
jgi:hypothetical protein